MITAKNNRTLLIQIEIALEGILRSYHFVRKFISNLVITWAI